MEKAVNKNNRILFCLVLMVFLCSCSASAEGKAPGSEIILRVGKSTRLSCARTGKKVKWSSSKKKVVSVSSKGKVYPKNADNKKLLWSSSDTKVAVVDQNGRIRAE